ncbi:Hermansky-Pudlak syndrome 4 protein isoform X1 [Thamnophis elegans]|uniref:Hermansky-Pudlak syndrome 4 protein isoform X1 n=1 Tax=Thamnophis elegans TaxID=35005 RepID=UPI0013768204|nr:Hermansky-Pudlak syndrome 4 protein isoform X1 [Thamnophis elegans]
MAPAWWRCFFLYDASKVRGEGDPTRAGICCFHPRQAPRDEQELLCGQIAGVARCALEISGSPPGLIRLRKLKFALEAEGSFLWVLGCTADLSDLSCRRLLERLLGLFRFYNGPASRAYLERPQEDLDREWELYVDHLQQSSSDLHRVFDSLWAWDKTKVDPLLLLKAALILQSCQRSRHVLAGCILYEGRVVSTQLPPELTARVLLQKGAEEGSSGPEEGASQLKEGSSLTSFALTALPPGVCVTPVYLLEAEAAALRYLPVEWTTRGSQEDLASSKGSETPAGGADGAPLVRMALYVHHIRGLVLALLAEEPLVSSTDFMEDVYHSSLASLNGLEVHLAETLPKGPLPSSRSTYNFAHYDAVQNILTTNVLQTTSPEDQLFLQGTGLIHATFEQLPTASELTLRNSSTAVYGCRNAVQESYFQQRGLPPYNSGVPNPRDSIVGLPGKARQKLLKHGVNLL